MSYSDLLIFHYELEDGSWEGVLTPTAFKTLIVSGRLEYPDISEEDINDRSKGDGISKSMALFQLFWFMMQIFIRSHYGLTTTFIEWTTVTLCLVSGYTYYFWMSKPFNAHFPIILRISGPEGGLMDGVNEPINTENRETSAGKSCLPHCSPSLTSPLFSAAHYFIPTIWDAIEGIVDSRDDHPLATGPVALFPRSNMESTATIFYVPPTPKIDHEGILMYPFAFFIGAVNGFPALLWLHPFPSHIEHILWRVGTCCSMLPFFAGIYYKRIPMIKDLNASNLLLFKTCLVWIHYFGRIIFLVICITTLRDLPDKTLRTVEWIDLLPHV